MPMLIVEPAIVHFGASLSTQRTYKETLTITNTLASPVVFSLRTSAPARLSVSPAECSLEAGESLSLQLKLFVAPASGGAAKQPQKMFRDTLFLQSTYFQQKVNVSFGIGVESLAPGREAGYPSVDPKGPGKMSPQAGGSRRKEPLVEPVGFGPAGYRALLRAEFEEKSEKVLKVLEFKDRTIENLEARLSTAGVDLDKSREECSAAKADLEIMRQKLAAKTRECDEKGAQLSESQRSDPVGIASQPQIDTEKKMREQQDQIQLLLFEMSKLQDELRTTQQQRPGNSRNAAIHEGGNVDCSKVGEAFQDFHDEAEAEASRQEQERGRRLFTDRVNASVSSKLQHFEATMRDQEQQLGRLKASLRQREDLLGEKDTHGRKLEARADALERAKAQLETEGRRHKAHGSVLTAELEAARRDAASGAAREGELLERLAKLEQLQRDAKETLLLSEARLREASQQSTHNASSLEYGEDDHRIAAGLPRFADRGGSSESVQLWWIELAQRTRKEQEARGQEKAGNESVAPPHETSDVAGSKRLPVSLSQSEGSARRLAEGAARVEQLEGHLKAQGVEVVFLRQELVAKDIELRRVAEDAKQRHASSARRVLSLEQAVRTTSAEGASGVRELEAQVRSLAGKSDVHAALAETRQALAAEKAAGLHREGEVQLAQQLLQASEQSCHAAAKECERLHWEAGGRRVTKSVEGVAGCAPLALIEHFAGVAELQAGRIRDLTEALCGKGRVSHSVLNNNAEEGGRRRRNGGGSESQRLVSGKWVRQWSVLEAHLLAKQTADLKEELSRVTSSSRAEGEALRSEVDAHRKEAEAERAEGARIKRALTQRCSLAEAAAAAAQEHLCQEQAGTRGLEDDLAQLKDHLDHTTRTLQANATATPSSGALPTGGGFATTSEEEEEVGYSRRESSGSWEEARVHLESLLAERTAQVGVLMETVDALQVAISGAAATGREEEFTGDGTGDGTGGAAEQPAMSSWSSQVVLKRIVKLTVECSSATALGAMSERRASSLNRSLEASEKEQARTKGLWRRAEAQLAESEAARQAGAVEGLRQRRELKSEVKALCVDVDQLRLATRALEQDGLACKEDAAQLSERLQVSEEHLKASRAQLNAALDEAAASSAAETTNRGINEREDGGNDSSGGIAELLQEFISECRNQGVSGEAKRGKVVSVDDEEEFLQRVVDLMLSADEKVRVAEVEAEAKGLRARVEETGRREGEGRCLSLQREVEAQSRRAQRLSQRLRGRDETLASQSFEFAKVLGHRVKTLYERLASSVAQGSAFAAEAATQRTIAEQLKRQLAVAHIAHDTQTVNSVAEALSSSSGAASTTAMVAELERQLGLREADLKEWFENELTDMLLVSHAAKTTGGRQTSAHGKRFGTGSRAGVGLGDRVDAEEEDSRCFALAQALCATKAAQSQLEAKLAATREQADGALSRLCRTQALLDETRTTAQANLATSSSSSSSSSLQVEAPLGSTAKARGGESAAAVAAVAVAAVELERRNSCLEERVRELESQVRCAEDEIGALEDLKSDHILQAQASDLYCNRAQRESSARERSSPSSQGSGGAGSEKGGSSGENRPELPPRSSSPTPHRTPSRLFPRSPSSSSGAIDINELRMHAMTLEREVQLGDRERAMVVEERDALVAEVASLSSDVQARDTAVHNLERALEDVLKLDTREGSDGGGGRLEENNQAAAAAAPLKGKKKMVRKKAKPQSGSVASSMDTHGRAGQRTTRDVLTLKLTQATLDAANWQQKARDLAGQVDALHDSRTTRTKEAMEVSRVVGEVGRQRRGGGGEGGSDSPQSVQDFDSSETEGDASTVGRGSSKQPSALFAASAGVGSENPLHQSPSSELRDAMASLADQVSQAAAAAERKESEEGERHELVSALKRVAAELKANEKVVAAKDSALVAAEQQHRKLLQRVASLQAELLDARRHVASVEEAKADAVLASEAESEKGRIREAEGEESAAKKKSGDEVSVSRSALVLLDRLLADSELEDNVRDSDDRPYGGGQQSGGGVASFNRLADRVRCLQGKLREATLRVAEAEKCWQEAEERRAIAVLEAQAARAPSMAPSGRGHESSRGSVDELEHLRRALSEATAAAAKAIAPAPAAPAESTSSSRERGVDIVPLSDYQEVVSELDTALEDARRLKEELVAVEACAEAAESKQMTEADARGKAEAKAQEERVKRREAESASEAAEERAGDLEAALGREKRAREALEKAKAAVAADATQALMASQQATAESSLVRVSAQKVLGREQAAHAEQVGLLRQQFLRYRSAQTEVTEGLERAVQSLRAKLVAHTHSATPPASGVGHSGGVGSYRSSSGLEQSRQQRAWQHSNARMSGSGPGITRGRAAALTAALGAGGVNRVLSRGGKSSQEGAERFAFSASNKEGGVAVEGLLRELSAREDECTRLRERLDSLQFEHDSKTAEAKALHKVLTATPGASTSQAESGGEAGRHQPGQQREKEPQALQVTLRETLAEVRMEVARQEVRALQMAMQQSREECAAWRVKATELSLEAAAVREANSLSQSSPQSSSSSQPPRVASLLQHVSRLKVQLKAFQEEASRGVALDEEVDQLRTALALAKEDAQRKGKLLAAMRAQRRGDEERVVEAEGKASELEEKLKRVFAESGRRKVALEEMQKRLTSKQPSLPPSPDPEVERRRADQAMAASIDAASAEEDRARLVESVDKVSAERARLKQQVLVLKEAQQTLSSRVSDAENEALRARGQLEKLGATKAALSQKETALKVCKTNLIAVGQELGDFKREASGWQQEAERRIREGQRRVETAEARANQAETSASVGRVTAGELEDLCAARDATVHELQRLRVVVRDAAQALFRQRNQVRANFRQRPFPERNASLRGISRREAGGGGRAEGAVASLLNLEPEELSDFLNGASDFDATSEEETRVFHRELTRILDAPLDEEELKAVLVGLSEERAQLDSELWGNPNHTNRH